MTPIEHFLLYIMQILFRDWIENTITDIGRCKVATHIFLPTLRNFFYKRWPIIFFYGRGFFFVRCCLKNLQSTSARFFRSTSIEVVVRPTAACFHLLGIKNISPPRKKTWFADTDRKKFWPTSTRKDQRSRFKKEASPDDADQTFPIRHHPNIIQGLNRKYNNWHRRGKMNNEGLKRSITGW